MKSPFEYETKVEEGFWIYHSSRYLWCDGVKNYFGTEVDGRYFVKKTEIATIADVRAHDLQIRLLGEIK